MDLAPNPCVSCPYRLDHPSGTWSYDEYEKLRIYDEQVSMGTFLCHQTNATGKETACKGWTSVHRDTSIAVRLAVLFDGVDPDAIYTDTSVALHESGNAAADAGQANIETPDDQAIAMVNKLVRSRAGKLD